MKKRILLISTIVLVIALLLLCFLLCFQNKEKNDGQNAIDDNQNAIFEYYNGLEFMLNKDGQSYTVTGISTSEEKNLVIPSLYNEKPITGIGEYAFCGIHHIESIIIPDSVIRIGDYAFYNCSVLEKIYLGKSVEFIGKYAFHAHPLVQIEVDSNNRHYKSINGHLCSKDGKELIYYCRKENEFSFTIPNGIMMVYKDSFQNIPNHSVPLFTFNEYNGAKYIGSEENPYLVLFRANYESGKLELHNDTRIIYSFNGSGEENADIVIPDYITYICPHTFYAKNLEVDSNNEYYKSINGSLYTKDGKTLVRAMPNGTSFAIPDGVEHIGAYAFPIRFDLESVTMPDTVKSIGEYAFYSCSSIRTINLSKSLETIGYSAFAMCSSLESIEIPDTVKTIGAIAFQSCGSLTNVVLPNGITKIYYSTFENCKSLKNINIPNSVMRMDAAFMMCSGLEEIVIPDSVMYIGNSTFLRCSSLKSINIPNSVLYIQGSAYGNCTSLSYIYIPESVIHLGDMVFWGCFSISNIEVDENNNCYKSIDGNLYNKDGTILINYSPGKEEQVYIISEDVIEISDFAFFGCDSLTSVIIPNSVVSIGAYAFATDSELLTIYCETSSQPDGWDSNWNSNLSSDNPTVVWGYNGNK